MDLLEYRRHLLITETFQLLQQGPKLTQKTSQEGFGWHKHYLDMKNRSMSINSLIKLWSGLKRLVIAAIRQTWHRRTEGEKERESVCVCVRLPLVKQRQGLRLG